MRVRTLSLAALARGLVTLALAVAPLAGCVSFDDLLVRGDAGVSDAGENDACREQCGPDAVDCFCADFDGPGDTSEGWVFETNGGGAYSAFVEDVQSTPNAALLTCPGSVTGVIGSAFTVLKRGVQSSTRSIRMSGSWKLRPYSRDAAGNFEFFSVALGSANRISLGEAFPGGAEVDPAFSIRVTYQDASGTVRTDAFPVAAPLTDNTLWVRFELDVTFADDRTGSVRLSWNGAEVLALSDLVTSSSDPGGTATLSASIGGGTLQGLTPDLWMLFDDVVVEVY